MYYVLCIMYNVATGVWGCALMEMAVVDCVLINWWRYATGRLFYYLK